MASIKLFINSSDEDVSIIKRENPNEDNIYLNKGDTSSNEVWVPWVANFYEFNTRVIEVTYMTSNKKIFIWEHQGRVFASKRGFDPSTPINGNNNSNGDKKLTINNDNVSLSEYNT